MKIEPTLPPLICSPGTPSRADPARWLLTLTAGSQCPIRGTACQTADGHQNCSRVWQRWPWESQNERLTSSNKTKLRAFKHHAPIWQNRCYRFCPGFPCLGFHHVDNLKGLIMTTYTPTIAYHAKSELRGWNEVCRYPADWEGWHSFDKSMIAELLKNGSQVVTCGWNMYQVVNDSV